MAYISSFYLPSEVSDRALRVPKGSAAVPRCGFSHLYFRLALTWCSCGALGLTAGQELCVRRKSFPSSHGSWPEAQILSLTIKLSYAATLFSQLTVPTTFPAPEPALFLLPCLDITSPQPLLARFSWACWGTVGLRSAGKGRTGQGPTGPWALCSHLCELDLT